MMDVQKASAGSGKTYTLAHTYIELLKDELSYRHILAVTFTNKATAEMKERILEYLAQDREKRRYLTKILHDYSAFSVSTIDRFFQQALKAFAREIGQMADYQVELDRESLIAETMDRILDSLSGDGSQDELLGWLKDSVSESLERGTKLNVEYSLHEMGKRLKNEERRQLRERHNLTDEEFSKKRLSAVRRSCRKIIRDFATRVKAEARSLPLFGNRYADAQREEYTGVVWYKTIDYPKKTLAKKAEGTAFMDLFGKDFKVYRTALLVERQIFSLGLAREFFAGFEALLKEKNVLCLDDSNTLLKRIISDSDAPFIYEKLGVRYENFLLDEFQDTSCIQWENFLPMLKESEGAGHKSLIVGDIKQSIYRWRDSDWRLLAETVEKEFPKATVHSRQENRRSCSQIVEFNNSFFEFAAKNLGLEKLYRDVSQIPLSGDAQSGHVELSFCEKDDEINEIVNSVEKALAAKARFSDIAVLVRRKKEGSDIAEELLRRGYPVVSDDSLLINSSLIVRKLLSLLSGIENPADEIKTFISRDENIEIPEIFHSLPDLCENLLRQLRDCHPAEFANETPFIRAFMDALREWTEVNGDNLRYFLQYWEQDERSISSPENSDSITVITVHKSKGLEFPYLIFPYAEKVVLFKDTERWCWLDAEGTPFDEAVSGIYSVNLSESTANTLFEDAYLEEREMQKVDNMNLFYVALTRAKCCLHIIASNPPKNYEAGAFKNFANVLYDFCRGVSHCEYGKMYDFSLLKRRSGKAADDFPSEYCSIDLAGRLSASQDAFDFFGEDGATGIGASPRRNGIVLHGIMSRIKRPEDIEDAVKDALLEGLLDKAQAEDAAALLARRIQSRRGFFEDGGYNERPVFDSDGNEYRPDRVFFKDGKAVVVDYKFGEEDEKYASQLRRYVRLYRELGYGEAEGYIWYLIPDKLVQVQ